jgi:hypothetical protein
MASEGEPYVLLQVRALLSGRLAVVEHPAAVGNDYDWGIGGMHQAWGLGTPLLALPLHLLGRLFGAPGFPDDVRFLLFYVATTVLFARALHRTCWREAGPVAPSTAAAFAMLFPTFVGMVSARFLIYEQTIAMGVLWNVLLLAGLLLLLDRCTPRRLAALCAAAGFAVMIRPTLAAYGGSTFALAILIGARKGLTRRDLAHAALAFGGVTMLFFVGNTLRFGSPFDLGYSRCVSGWYVNRLARWGLPFANVPFSIAAKEMFASLFLLKPVGLDLEVPPPAVLPYAVGDRWREYYTPTFDLSILTVTVVAMVYAIARVVGGKLWQRDRALDDEAPALLAVWGLGPLVALFVFYTRIGNFCTRYAVDMVPALSAAYLCAGSAAIGAARAHTVRTALVTQALIAVALVKQAPTLWRGWPEHLSSPVDRATLVDRIALIDAASVVAPDVPSHYEAAEYRTAGPIRSQLQEWRRDGVFGPGMAFAIPWTPCLAFTFLPNRQAFGEEVKGVRVTADADSMVSCGSPVASGRALTVTMCEPQSPRHLLDGLRLYSVAVLNDDLTPRWPRLIRIDAVPACP